MLAQKQYTNIDYTDTPADIDFLLREEINRRIKEAGTSYDELSTAIADDVKSRFSKIHYLVSDGILTQEAFDKLVSKNTPSRSYIGKYAQGQSICIRYTNSIAMALGIDYKISAYDAAQDTLRELELHSKI